MKNKEKSQDYYREIFGTYAKFSSYVFTMFKRCDYKKFTKMFKKQGTAMINALFSWKEYKIFMRAADVYEFQGLKLMLDLFPTEKQKIILQDEKKAAGLLSLILNPSNNKENKYKINELFNEIITKNNNDPLLETHKQEVIKTLINAIHPNVVKLFQNKIDDLMGQGQSSSDEIDNEAEDIGNAEDSEKEEDICEQPKKKVCLKENQIVNLEAQNMQNMQNHLEQQENKENENKDNENNVQQNNNGNQEQQPFPYREAFETFCEFCSYTFTLFNKENYEEFNATFKYLKISITEELFSWEDYKIFAHAAKVGEFHGLKLMLELFPTDKLKIILQNEKKAIGLLSLILNPSSKVENKYKINELFNEIITKNNNDPLLETYKLEVIKTLINAIHPNVVKLFQNEIDDLMGRGQSSSDEIDDESEDVGKATDSEKEEDICEQPKKKVCLEENQVVNLEAQNMQNTQNTQNNIGQQENKENENKDNENNAEQNNNGNQEQQQNANIIHDTYRTYQWYKYSYGQGIG